MTPCRFLILSALATLAACGGGAPEADTTVSAASAVAWPLFDDDGNAMPGTHGAAGLTGGVPAPVVR